MSSNIYRKDELRYFRLAKGVINYSTEALRQVFKQEWNYLYHATPWRNDGTSGSQMLADERPPSRCSRLYDPKFAKEYQAIKDHLRHGDVEEWDVTTLAFALLYAHSLNGIRNGSQHWIKVKKGVHKIKEVRNTVLSHACKASISHSTFRRTFSTLELALSNLVTTSHPLVGKLKMLRSETEFVTDDLVKLKKLLCQDHQSLLVLDRHLKKLECKMKISVSEGDAEHASTSAETTGSSEIISKFCRRVDKLEQELSSPVDLMPSRSKPSIFHSAKYIRLVNVSNSMSYNFRWKELDKFLQEFVGADMQMFAGIQSAVALSHQSKKDESFEILNSLIPKALLANQYG